MSEKVKKNAVRYKPLFNENGVGYKSECSLNKIFFPGCYSVEIDHKGINVGLPIDDCGDEHYIVGNLFVTDCGTMGPKQHNRVTGQVLVFTTRVEKVTKIYTRTFADGEWSKWRTLAETGMYDNISTTDELIATVEALSGDMNTLKGDGEGSVSAMVDAAVEPLNQMVFKNSMKILDLQVGDTAAAMARDVYSEQGKIDVSSYLKRTTAGHTSVRNGYAELRQVGGNAIKVINSMENIAAHTNAVIEKYDNSIVAYRSSFSNSIYGVRFVNNTYKGQNSHKYYSASLVYSDIDNNNIKIFINDYSTSFTIKNGWSLVSTIRSGENIKASNDILQCTNVESEKLVVANHIFIDLTEMYGVGNEPTRDECDKLFAVATYLPSGINVATPVTYESVGYNQCDTSKSMPAKTVADGVITDGANTLVAVPCLPCKLGIGENNGYIIGNGMGYDWSEAAIQAVYFTPFNPQKTTRDIYLEKLEPQFCEQCNGGHNVYLPTCVGYLLIETTNTDKLCAHFAWSGDRDYRDYEPYIRTEVKLPQLPQMSEWGLPGLSASGTAARDTIDLENKKYIKRIGRVNLGELGWKYSTNNEYGYNVFYSTELKGRIKNANSGKFGNILTLGYTIAPASALTSKVIPNKCIMLYISNGTLYIRDDAYTSVAEFTAALSEQHLYYELAVPEVYDITDNVFKNFVASDYGTENFTGSSVPLGDNAVFFMRSLVGELRNLLDKLYDTFSTTEISALVERIHGAVEPNAVVAE